MSQDIRENENGDQEAAPTDSSETSSTSSCTTTGDATTTSSLSTSTTSSTDSSTSSDADDNNASANLYRHKHRLCHQSTGLSREGDDHDGGNVKSLESNHESVIDRIQQSITRQECDTETTTNCPCSSKSEFPVKSFGHGQQLCQTSYSKTTETTNNSPPFIQAPQQHQQSTGQMQASQGSQARPQSDSDKSQLDRFPISDESNSLNHPHKIRYNLNTNATSLASSYSNLSSNNAALEPSASDQIQPKRILKPAPSPSPSMSIIDTNNNKNNSFCSKDGLTSIKRTNFSKSASGSRLISRGRQIVCDCLTQDCGEKKHSNRRQYIEHYYNSRTQLPSANTSTSSFNISTPLNRLSECDAITRRLLSSPIRTTNLVESPTRRAQMTEVDKSRRASLGTNSITDQVFLFASNPLKSSDTTSRANVPVGHENQDGCETTNAQSGVKNDFKLKQQGRSLSVCDEETLNPRQRASSTNYPSNLNRAISLASESGSTSSTRRYLTMIPLFGCDMKSLEQFTKFGSILPPVIDSAVDHILVNGINSIGIFRKSGVKSRILTLRQRIEANQTVNFDEINQNNEFSIYDIADLVKMWFRELKPLPLMTKELIKLISAFLNTSNHVPQASVMKRGNSSQQDTRISTGKSIISALKYVDSGLKSKIDSMTTSTHRALLLRVLNFLAQISARCESNQMTSQNLAICLTPSLCATESDQNSILLAQKALEYSIDNHRILFGL